MTERKAPIISRPVSDAPWSIKDVRKPEAIEWLKEHRPNLKKYSTKVIRRTRRKLSRRDWKKSLPRGRDETISASDISRDIIYGEVRVGGTINFLHVKKAHKAWYHHIFCIAGHEIDSVQKMYIDGIEIQFASSGGSIYGWATGPTGEEPGTKESDTERDFTNRVFVKVVHGASDQLADGEILAQLEYIPDGESDVVWSESHRGRGVAYVYVIFNWSAAAFGEGDNEVEFLVRGKKVYDPRDASTAWSQNAALCIADYLTDTSYGKKIPWAKIDTADASGGLHWAADVCDQSVSIVGGSEARFALNGKTDRSQSPRQILEAMVTAFAGTIAPIEGKWKFFPGCWRTPVSVELTEQDLRGPITIESLISKSETFNAIRGTFVDAANNYEETDFPSINLAGVGDEVMWEDIQLPFTTSSTTAQRIARIYLAEAIRSATITAPFSLKALQLTYGDIPTVTMSRYGFSASTYQVEDFDFGLDNLEPIINLVLRAIDANAYADTTEQAAHEARVTILPSPSSATNPTGLTLASGTDHLDIRADGTIFSRIYAEWTAPDDPFVTDGGHIEVQRKKSTSSTWTGQTLLPGDTTHVYILDVLDGVNYDVRIRSINALGKASATWLTESNHNVIGKTAPPADVASIDVASDEYGINIVWDAVDDLDLKHYELRYGGSAWGDSTLITRVKGTAYTWARKTAGSYTFRIKAVDTSNNYSTNETTDTLTISGPSTPTLTLTIEGEDVRISWPASTGTHAIKEYEIRYGSTWAGGTSIGRFNTLSHKRKVDWSGSRVWWVAAYDVAGNVSTAGSEDLNIVVPGQVASLTSTQVDNNVLIDWEVPATGTLPVVKYQCYKGATFAGATSIGSVDGTFKPHFEQLGGAYTYWVRAVDSAGNAGSERSISLNVQHPPDFILRADDYITTTSGDTETNIMTSNENADLTTRQIYANTTRGETWTTHFTNNSWTCIQDAIDASYTQWLQPAPTTGVFEEAVDLGAVMPGSLISVTWAKSDLVAGITVTPRIYYKKLVGDAWTAGTDGLSELYAVEFQYIKVKLTFTAATDKAQAIITDVHYRVTVKKQTDSGVVSVTATGGTAVTFNLDFLDVESVVATPQLVGSGTVRAKFAIVDFTDVPNPTGFVLYLFDKDGAEVSGGNLPVSVRWTAEGVVDVVT
jgi:hypothetical protein